MTIGFGIFPEVPKQTINAAAALFDGTNDYMKKASAIVAAYQKGICSFWFRQTGFSGDEVVFSAECTNAGDLALKCYFSVSLGGLVLLVVKSGTTDVYFGGIVTASVADGEWHHIVFAWDASVPAYKVLFDGVLEVTAPITGVFGGGVGAVPTKWTIGAQDSAAGKASMEISEFYLTTNVYPDLALKSVQRKFISAHRRPVFLGSTGAKPTGTQAEIYLKGSGTGFNINSGSGGDFTTTGALTAPTTTPSIP